MASGVAAFDAHAAPVSEELLETVRSASFEKLSFTNILE